MNTFTQFGVKTLLPSPAGFILMQNFVEDCKEIGWKYCEEFNPFTQKQFESIKGILYFSNQFYNGGITIGPDTLMSLTQGLSLSRQVFTLESQYSEALEYVKKTYQQAMSPISFTSKMGDYIFLETTTGYRYIFISSGDKENPTKAITGYNAYLDSLFSTNKVSDVGELDDIVKEFRYATTAERSLLDRELTKAGLRFDSSNGCLKKLVKYKKGGFYSDVEDPFSSSATIFQCVEIKDGEVCMKHVAGKEGGYFRSNHPKFGEIIKFWDTVTLTPIGEDL